MLYLLHDRNSIRMFDSEIVKCEDKLDNLTQL